MHAKLRSRQFAPTSDGARSASRASSVLLLLAAAACCCCLLLLAAAGAAAGAARLVKRGLEMIDHLAQVAHALPM